MEPTAAGYPARPASHPVHVVVWVLHLALPMAGLWLLLAQPATDAVWQDPASHFWLVLGVAVLNVGLAWRVGVAARGRDDARLFLVSLAFGVSAGFLALHALATPRVLLGGSNAGFDVAQPVGLALASVFALASAVQWRPERARQVLALHAVLWASVAALIVGWAIVSVSGLPPLDHPVNDRETGGWLAGVAVVSVAFYTGAAVRYYLIHRRRPAAMLISVVTAFALLAEAMIAVTVAHKWHLSWWEWHVLLTAAFGFVAYSAYVQYRREGTAGGVFDAITLEETVLRLRGEYSAALEEMVAELEEREQTGRASAPTVTAKLVDHFGLSEGQMAVLDRAGAALAAERARSREIGTLFRWYMSPDVAAALIADPSLAALGGQVTEVTALFADLRGFTAFSEAVEPGDIVAMLNRYHGVAVPCILGEGGTVVQFVGDALLALFNAPARQPDHAARAVRAALQMQESVTRIAGLEPDWPRFRIGVNTGAAMVGNIGSEELRGFNAMGDAVNVAAHLQAIADPGQVVVGEPTWTAVRDTDAAFASQIAAESLGELTLKTRRQPMTAFALVRNASLDGS